MTDKTGRTTNLQKRTLHLECPLCQARRFRLSLITALPKHTFNRTCPGCWTEFDVYVKTLVNGPDIFVDRVIWLYGLERERHAGRVWDLPPADREKLAPVTVSL
jgi:hypothetical protein